jgi:ubiquinone/menaquinone biosynthesis C-methylase UbiE
VNSKNDWKQFYRKQYADQWKHFSGELALQHYHVKYQEICLEPIRAIQNGYVLEVGAGRGDLLSKFPHESNHVVGCDLSEGNIVGCNERFNELQRSVYLSHADAEQLPFLDDTFDAVYSLSVLWYIPDYRNAIKEMFRVAKPGGLVVFDMLNTLHITSLSNHFWRHFCRLFGRELGHTSLSSTSMLCKTTEEFSDDFHVYGNYLLLPAFLPILKEAGNWCRYFPSMAYAMSEGTSRALAHKLLVVARKR